MSSFRRSLEQVCFVVFLFILVWAPLPFASNREWAGALLCLLVTAVSATWLSLQAFTPMPINRAIWARGRWALLMLVLVQLWTFFQLIPLPLTVLAVMSPQAEAWHIGQGLATLSLDPVATTHYLLVGCTITQGFFLALVLLNSHARVKTLLMVLVLSGVFQALYGAFMVLSGLEIGFFVEKYAGRGVATGTFVNRNHLAGYLVMCLAAGTGLLLSQLETSIESRWRDRLRGWLRFMLGPKMRLRIYLAVMVIALVLTRSRMGNVAFFVSLSIAGIVAVYAGRRFSARLVGLLASLFLIDMLILSRWFGLDRLMARFEQMEGQPVEADARYWLDRFSWDYIGDFSLTGSGGGSFYGVFPSYQGPQLQGYYEHVHNDYLEFATELGMPALLLLAVFVLFCLWQAIWVQRERMTPLYLGVGFAVTMSICWCLMHATADFNLQIPANAYTFVVILAMAFVCRGLPSNKSPVPSL